MKMQRLGGVALAVVALGAGLLGAGYAVAGSAGRPAYTSSVQVPDRDREERGDHRDENGEARGERREAGRLAALAKIDAAQAIAAAVAKVPGTGLEASLDDENGNLVYSVAIETPTGGISDVKVDAGNGAVPHVGAGDRDEDES